MFLSWIRNRNNSGTRIPLLFQLAERQRLFLVSSTKVSRAWESSSKPRSMTGEVSITHTALAWKLKMPSGSIVLGCRGAAKAGTHGCWIADGFCRGIRTGSSADGSAAFTREEFRLPRTMQGAVGTVGMPELFWRGFRLSFGCLHLQSTHRVFSCARGPWVPLHKPSPRVREEGDFEWS